ncbi:MAG: DUF4294 domain-containing protein [Bacteroidales bacterium]|nr:DUF4294 domain-containing protein [Bacteroidales bacterium]
MKKIIAITVYFFCLFIAKGQDNTNGYDLPGVVVNGDTLAVIKIPKVYVFPKLKFTSKEEYVRYKKLVRDVKKVYPYSQIAKKTFIEVENIMDSLPNNKQRKQYIKAKEDELVQQYSKELISMTIHQGEILIKLVNRELNHSPFEVIKELRGGFTAAMWQGVAKMFGESLKNGYDATGEDLLIERIVLQIEQGTI